MTSPRAWNLRLNLDEFNALSVSLYADADRALALQGLTLGANGGELPGCVPDAFRRGWELGQKMYQEALDFQAKQAERGRSSAAKRRELTGSAQPSRFEPPLEHRFEPPLDETSNLTTIDNRQSTERQTTNPEQRASARDGSGRIPASEWTTLKEHRDLCALRNVDHDLQLSRFRERNVGQLDTDQGWSVRFRQWIGTARPETRVSPNAVASPTMDEWIAFARTIQHTSEGIWPKDAAEAGWLENQAKGWRYVTDWKADCTARSKRWAANEKTISQRRRNA